MVNPSEEVPSVSPLLNPKPVVHLDLKPYGNSHALPGHCVLAKTASFTTSDITPIILILQSLIWTP